MELLGIIISITPAFNIYIKTTSSLAYRNSLGVVIYSINKEDDPISIDVQAHSPFFTFDSNGHIEEGLILDEVSIKYIFAEELNTIKGHIKEFFTPNSVKFIGSF